MTDKIPEGTFLITNALWEYTSNQVKILRKALEEIRGLEFEDTNVVNGELVTASDIATKALGDSQRTQREEK